MGIQDRKNKYLNDKMLLEIFADDRELVNSALTSFAETLPSLLGPWEKSFKEKNYDKLAKSSHALKGAVLAFGCQEMAQKLGELCKLCRENRVWDEVHAVFQGVWSQMRLLVLELKYWSIRGEGEAS